MHNVARENVTSNYVTSYFFIKQLSTLTSYFVNGLCNVLDTLWLVLFQALVAMGDKVNIDTISVACTAQNGSSDNDLEFFSTKGVLRLEMDKSSFNLSYSVVTSATGELVPYV